MRNMILQRETRLAEVKREEVGESEIVVGSTTFICDELCHHILHNNHNDAHNATFEFLLSM